MPRPLPVGFAGRIHRLDRLVLAYHPPQFLPRARVEWLLKLNGELIGRFKSPDEARACAEIGVKTAREVEERL